jgi:hypothetical protein
LHREIAVCPWKSTPERNIWRYSRRQSQNVVWRQRWSRRHLRFELLEPRTLLSAEAAFDPTSGSLSILDSGVSDLIEIDGRSGFVRVNGADPLAAGGGTSVVPVEQVTSIAIDTGLGDDRVVFSGLSSAWSSLSSIRVDTGGGRDTVAFQTVILDQPQLLVSLLSRGDLDLLGDLRVTGGIIEVRSGADGVVQLAGSLQANAAVLHGSGKILLSQGVTDFEVLAADVAGPLTVTDPNTLRIASAKGLNGIRSSGGDIFVRAADTLSVEAPVVAYSADGIGGDITLLGDWLEVGGTTVDSSGAWGGGALTLGGGPPAGAVALSAARVKIREGAMLRADATESGDGGLVTVWADESVVFGGVISARGAGADGRGGFAEVSSGGGLSFTGAVDLTATSGRNGTFLLDPKNIIVRSGGTATLAAAGDADGDNQLEFSENPTGSVVVAPSAITAILDTGTSVTLAAHTDITVTDAIVANNPAGNGGELILAAGRSLLINNSVVTDSGNLRLHANVPWSNSPNPPYSRPYGIRDSGNAAITMGDGASLDAGTGTVTVWMMAMSSSYGGSPGDITLEHVTGGTVYISNSGEYSEGDDILRTSDDALISATSLSMNAYASGTVGTALCPIRVATADLLGLGKTGFFVDSPAGSLRLYNAGSPAAVGTTSSGDVVVTAHGYINVSKNVIAGGTGRARLQALTSNLLLNANVTAGGDVELETGGGLMGSGNVQAGAARTVFLTADSMVLGGTITASGGVVNVQPYTGGGVVTADLGGADNVLSHVLGLDAAELAKISTGTLRVGSAGTAAVQISQEMDLSVGITTLALTSGGTVTDSSGVTIANLGIRSAGSVTLDGSNNVGTLAAEVSGPGNSFQFIGETNGYTIGSVDGLTGIRTAGAAGVNSGWISLGTSSGTIWVNADVVTGDATTATGLIQSGGMTISTGGAGSPIYGNGRLVVGAATAGGVLNDRATAGSISMLAAEVSADGENPLRVEFGQPSGGNPAGNNTPGKLNVTVAGSGTAGEIRILSAAPLVVGHLDTLNGSASAVDFEVTGGAALTLAMSPGGNLDLDDVRLAADEMYLPTSLTTTGSVTLAPSTAGHPLDLGAKTAGKLSLTDAELDRILNATVLRVGSLQAGNIVVSGPLDPAGTDTLQLLSQEDISGGAHVVTENSLALQARSATLTTAVGNLAVETSTGNVTISNTGSLTISTVAGLAGITSPSDTSSATISAGGTGGEDVLTVGAGVTVKGRQGLSLSADRIEISGTLDAIGSVAQLHAVSGGVTENAGASVSAGQLVLTGVGSFSLPMSNSMGVLAADVDGSLMLNNSGLLVIGTVGATAGVAATGTVTLTANSPLRADADVVADGTVALTALEGAPGTVGDDLTVSADVTVQSTTGAVNLTAGDNVEIAAGAVLSAATQLKIVADPAIWDNDTAGARITVAGSLQAPDIRINGGSDADEFLVGPSLVGGILLDGGTPSFPRGDTLRLDLAGVQNPAGGGLPNGTITSSSHAPLTYLSIETLPPVADAGGPYTIAEGQGLSLDASGSHHPAPGHVIVLYEWDFDCDGTYDLDTSVPQIAAAPQQLSNAGLADGPRTSAIRLRIRDNDGETATADAVLSIGNVAPTITDVTNSGPVDGGAPVTVTIAATDPAGANDPLTYEWDFDNDGTYEVSDSSPSAQHTFADNGEYLVGVRVSDGDGGLATSSTTVTVDHVAPTLSNVQATPSTLDEGQSTHLTGTISKPGAVDTLTLTIDWGDGSGVQNVDLAAGATNFDIQHSYADDDADDQHTITVALRDDDLMQRPTWTQLSPTGTLPGQIPSQGIQQHGAVYDSDTQRMIVFDGLLGPNLSGYGTELDHVLVLHPADGSAGTPQWAQLNIPNPHPPARANHDYVYDSLSNRLTAFAGNWNVGSCTATLNDLWILIGADGSSGTPQWQQQTPTGGTPGDRHGYVLDYDPGSNRMILFGGSKACNTPYNDVWILENANGLDAHRAVAAVPNWVQLSPTGPAPSPRAGSAAIYDQANNRLVVFGGGGQQDVWILSHANGLGGTPAWSQLAPQPDPEHGTPGPMSSPAAVYDPDRNRLYLYGDGTQLPNNAADDVWMLEHANGLGGSPQWRMLEPLGTLPAPRQGHPAVFDPNTDRLIVFGGRTNNPLAAASDLWVLDLYGLDLASTASTTVTVRNVPPALSGVAFASPVYEGVAAHLTGTITDPGTADALTLVVNWGDGSSEETLDLAAGATAFETTHVYADSDLVNRYPVVVRIRDDDSPLVTVPGDLLSWWPGDGSPADVQDSNAGTPQGDATYAAGKYQQAFSFDGYGDRVVGALSGFAAGNSPVTVTGWFQADQVYGHPGKGILGIGSPGVGQHFYLRLVAQGNSFSGIFDGPIDGQNRLWLGVDSGGLDRWWGGNSVVLPGQWYHVAATYEPVAREIKTYLNGVPERTAMLGGDLALTNDFLLGGDGHNDNFFDGLIDEPKAFTRALTEAEIQAEFAAGQGYRNLVANVLNVNEPPVLTAIGDKSMVRSHVLTLTATATDPDLPADTLTFTLDTASLALGMTIDPTTGDFQWTPAESLRPGGYTVTVTVADAGDPALSDAETLTIVVVVNWQNPQYPCDVTGDGLIDPDDVLVLINCINADLFGNLAAVVPPVGDPPPFLDPSGDGAIGPLDVLIVINYINTHEPEPLLSAAGGEGERVASFDHAVFAPIVPSGMRTADTGFESVAALLLPSPRSTLKQQLVWPAWCQPASGTVSNVRRPHPVSDEWPGCGFETSEMEEAISSIAGDLAQTEKR